MNWLPTIQPLDLPLWLDILIAMLLTVGAGFALLGSWGLAKLSTFTRRLHGPSKATTLGVGCVLMASALWFGFQGETSGRELLVALFLMLTAPVSALLLMQAARGLDRSIDPPPKPPLGESAHRADRSGRPAHLPDAPRAAETESSPRPR